MVINNSVNNNLDNAWSPVHNRLGAFVFLLFAFFFSYFFFLLFSG